MSLFIRCRDVQTGKYCGFEQTDSAAIETMVDIMKSDSRVTDIQIAEDDGANFRVLRTLHRESEWR